MKKILRALILTHLSIIHLSAMQNITYLGNLPANGPLGWHKTAPNILMIADKTRLEKEDLEVDSLEFFDMSIPKQEGTKTNYTARVASARGPSFKFTGWHPQNPHIVAMTTLDTKTIYIIEVDDSWHTHKEIFTCTRTNHVNSFAWHPTHHSIAAFGFDNGDIEIWNIKDQSKPLSIIPAAHDDTILLLKWDCKGTPLLASTSFDGIIKTWSVDLNKTPQREICKPIHVLKPQKNLDELLIHNIIWHPHQNSLALITRQFKMNENDEYAGIQEFTVESHDLDQNKRTLLFKIAPSTTFTPYKIHPTMNNTFAFTAIKPEYIYIKWPSGSVKIPVKHEEIYEHDNIQKPFCPAFSWNPQYPDLLAYSTEDKIVRIVSIKNPTNVLSEISCYRLDTGIAMLEWNQTGNKLAISVQAGSTITNDIYQVDVQSLLAQ